MTQAVALAQYGSTGVSQGFKNRFINGNMVISQRGTTFNDPGSNQYTLDRWHFFVSVSGKINASQSSIAPDGFINSMLVTSASAYTIGSSDYFQVGQPIEGYNTADWNWGTANAKTVTVSFWVRSSVTGTFSCLLINADASMNFPFNYTISNANTWTYVTQTVTGPTSGTFATNNTTSVELRFAFGIGTNSQNGTAGVWSSNYWAPGATTSFVGTNGATWYMTGAQIETGSTATSFDYRDYGTELQLCQRYYQTTGSITGIGANSSVFQGFVTYGVQMRIVNPTFALNAVLRITDGYASNHTMSSLSGGYSVNQSSPNLQYIQFNNFSGLTQGRFYGIYGNANTDAATLSAEL
jgi:hypothetical protein